MYSRNDLFHKTTLYLYRQKDSESPEQCPCEAKLSMATSLKSYIWGKIHQTSPISNQPVLESGKNVSFLFFKERN